MPWNSDRLLQQLQLGEDSLVEFKEVGFAGKRIQDPRRETVADELAAFGNTIGGTLIFSVSDAGEVRSMNREQMDALEAFVGEICSDSIRPPLAFVTQRLALADGSFVLVVEVAQSSLVHKSPGGYLARQGSSRRELSPEALNRLFQQRGRSGLSGPDEAIVNAVVHRDYSMENGRIRLFIFDDRLELYSPGALPNTLPIEAMRNRQATRNETLASILRMLAVGDIPGVPAKGG